MDVNPEDKFCDKCGRIKSQCKCTPGVKPIGPTGTTDPIIGPALGPEEDSLCPECGLPLSDCKGHDTQEKPSDKDEDDDKPVNKTMTCVFCGRYIYFCPGHPDNKKLDMLIKRTGLNLVENPLLKTSDPNIQHYIQEILLECSDLGDKINFFRKNDKQRIESARDTVKNKLEQTLVPTDTPAGVVVDNNELKLEWHNMIVEQEMDLHSAMNIIISCLGTKKSEINTDLLNDAIPLADEIPGGGAGTPAWNLLMNPNTIKISGYSCGMDVLKAGGYLVVEPITWLNFSLFGIVCLSNQHE